MTNIKLYVNGAHARAQVFGELVAGTVGITIDAKFNDEWNDLAKHLVCRNGKVVKTKLDFQNGFTVAPETMIAGGNLEIGFEGMSQDGNIVFPTVWATCGVVKDGANANDDYSADPTNPVWDQLEKQIGDLSKLETSAKDSIVEAVNEVAKKNVKIPVATTETLGGVKAEPATEADTQPVRIGADGMLFTVPGGGGEKWETIIDYTVPEDCAEVLLKTDIHEKPFKLKEAIVTFLIMPHEGVTGSQPLRYTVDAKCLNAAGISAGVYGAEHYAYGVPTGPSAAGKCSVFRIHVVGTPYGVHLLGAKQTQNIDYPENATIGLRNTDVFEPFNSSTLLPRVTEITAAGVGSYVLSVGKGTRIVMVGVRE